MDSFDILVIILSTALAIFLVLGIIALVKVISILKAVQRLSGKAEHIADAAADISDTLLASAKKVSFASTFASLGKMFSKHNKED